MTAECDPPSSRKDINLQLENSLLFTDKISRHTKTNWYMFKQAVFHLKTPAQNSLLLFCFKAPEKFQNAPDDQKHPQDKWQYFCG